MISSLSLVRYRGNDYSVPTAYGHQEVLVRGYLHKVVIACGADIIARHHRSWEKEDYVFDPLHYLALIAQKPNALDQAAPLADWELPEAFIILRRLMEARLGKKGKREFFRFCGCSRPSGSRTWRLGYRAPLNETPSVLMQ